MVAHMIVMRTTAVGYIPDTYGAILKDGMTILYNFSHIFEIYFVFFPV